MGYTHYSYQKKNLNQKRWNAFRDDARAIVGEALGDGIRIRGPHGGGNPTFNNDRIMLNGDQDRNEDYESFIITRKGSEQLSDYGNTRGMAFDCCKTRGDKPYDAVVVAVLLAFKTHFPDEVIIRSDGRSTDGDFTKGTDLFERALGVPCNPAVLFGEDEDDDEPEGDEDDEIDYSLRGAPLGFYSR